MNRDRNHAPTVTTRSALREITRSAYGSPPSISNMLYFGSPSPSTSPDEEVVRRRGRRIISPGNQFALTPPRTPTKRQLPPKSSSSTEHPQTPSKAQLSLSPVRSSPRKRLLLPAEISDAIGASPSKKLVSPVKRLRLQSRDAEAETEVALTGLTKAQLVTLLKDTMGRSPDAKQVIHELLPKPDLAHSVQKLEKLLHQIYRAFPQKHWGNSRDAFCFRRVQIPIETFKPVCSFYPASMLENLLPRVQRWQHLGIHSQAPHQGKALVRGMGPLLRCAGWYSLCCGDACVPSLQRKCLERAQQLCQAEQWCSLLQYAQQAWNFVRKMPDWEDASHNKAKQLCFRSLATHSTTALKKASLDQRQLQALVSRFREMKEDSPCIASPLKLAEAQLEQPHQ
ncbi:hypothetical protein V5799_034128 [Amblyomma americanum]|uniref:Uncharacterized protein n=1 Tax=Amblyomma americanum TaxID=6943 RepID=A0AAQ4DLC2_AMBAM